MLAVYLKELNTFFSSLIGYMAIVVFLIIISLFVWVFPDFSVLEYGFATLDTLFLYAPWIFLLLIPAITMRSFSEEISSGTIELLATRPLKDTGIIMGKYFAALTLVVFSIAPTLIYFWSLQQLGSPPGNMDAGATWGSYVGLLLLGSVFVSIGIFSSSITSNQIVAFVLSVFLCFIFYIGFELISGLNIFYAKVDDIVELIGINAHYASISRGVLDTRDLIYFLSINLVFIMLAKISIESRKW